MKEEGISLAGAVHEYTDPATGKDYLYFPIRKIDEAKNSKPPLSLEGKPSVS